MGSPPASAGGTHGETEKMITLQRFSSLPGRASGELELLGLTGRARFGTGGKNGTAPGVTSWNTPPGAAPVDCDGRATAT